VNVALEDPTVEVRNVVREITQAVARRTGRVGPEVVRAITEEVLAALDLGRPPVLAVTAARLKGNAADPQLLTCLGCEQDHQAARQDRVVVTATGHNRKGIVARLTAVIDDCGGDIRDISQTIVNDYFTMIIVVDVQSARCDYAEFRSRVAETAAAVGVEVMLMRDKTLAAMQRL
jgi:ACT domain-containing protein